MSLAAPNTAPAGEPQPNEPEFEINVAEYMAIVRRHWRLVAALTICALAAGSIHFAITPKAYIASATVQIERRSLSPLVNSQNPWLDAYNLEFYPTQYKLLESRGLAERVVKNLNLMDDPLFNPAAGRLGSSWGAPGSSHSVAAPAGQAAGALPRIGGVAGHEGTAKATAEEDQAVLGHLADALRGGLSVEPIRNTELVVLSYRHSSPEFAARAANGFAEAFIDMGVEDRFSSAGKASSFLGTQIEALKQEIGEKEAQLQAFSRKKDIVTLAPGSNVTLQRLETLNGNYMEAKKNRIDREAEYHEVLSKPPETVADSLSGGLVSDLRAQQIRLESDYETRLKIYKPEWPAMVELKGQMERGQQHLESVVKEMASKAVQNGLATYQTALRQEQSLESEINKLKSEALDLSSESVQFNNLKVEVQTRRDMLNDLLRKQSETEVSARLQNTRDSNIRIIDHAMVPGAPFYPSLRNHLSTGLLVGLVLGIATAFLLEFMDRTIKTPEEVERRLALPTLAVIPDLSEASRSYGYLGEAQPAQGVRARAAKASGATAWLEKRKGAPSATPIELVPHLRPRTPISEAYRSLRTGLLLSSAEELKVIAVTSAEAGEGKTATATNLAVVLAQLGRQVLLVDADLRKPRLHEVFQLSNRVGLVNQLTASGDGESSVQRTSVANLWLTCSGPLPPNPSELLASDRMREWLRAARSRFDMVIVDTPPALAVTDSTLVGALSDGVVLTLRSGKVAREDARACRDRLQYSGVRILGVVLNRYRPFAGGLGRRYRYYESYAYVSKAQTGSAA